MPKLNLSDGRNHILRGILTSRGITGKDVAKVTKKPVSTVTYQIRNADNMTLESFQTYVNALNMSDPEILAMVRGKRNEIL